MARHTSAVPDKPRPMAGAIPSKLDSIDWDILLDLVEDYGVEELIRSLRLWQMATILNTKHEEPSGENKP